MPASIAGMRFPFSRVLLPRTRLAYVHLRNLLTDAKRDRAARVSGYVAIWLPDELILLYMQRGEVVNATACDGAGRATPKPSGEPEPTRPAAGYPTSMVALGDSITEAAQSLSNHPEP